MATNEQKPIGTGDEPLVLTKEADELTICLANLKSISEKLNKNLDELGDNIRLLNEENAELKKALGLQEDISPIKDFYRILNGK
tara:strand:- start:361 stop:612 length:252 start_codon:yes stop_codon:yes gene_type:complete